MFISLNRKDLRKKFAIEAKKEVFENPIFKKPPKFIWFTIFININKLTKNNIPKLLSSRLQHFQLKKFIFRILFELAISLHSVRIFFQFKQNNENTFFLTQKSEQNWKYIFNWNRRLIPLKRFFKMIYKHFFNNLQYEISNLALAGSNRTAILSFNLSSGVITYNKMFLLVLLAIVLILVAHYFYLLFNSDYWAKKGVFCPNPRLLFGNLPNQVFGKKYMSIDLDELYQQYKDKHSFIGVFNFRKPRLIVFEPEIIKDIFIKYFKNFQGNEFTGAINKKSDPLFGNHPFFLINNEWRDKRGKNYNFLLEFGV